MIRTGTGTYTGDGLNLQNGQQVYGAGETLSFTNPVNGSRQHPERRHAADHQRHHRRRPGHRSRRQQYHPRRQHHDRGRHHRPRRRQQRRRHPHRRPHDDLRRRPGGRYRPGRHADVALEFVSSSGGAQGIQLGGGLTGTFTVSGNLNITNSATAGIDINGNTGTYNFNGTKAVNTGTHDAITLNNAGTVNFANGGLDIDTTSGTGFAPTAAPPPSPHRKRNSIIASGQVVNWNGVTIGAKISPSALGATNTVANTAQPQQ